MRADQGDAYRAALQQVIPHIGDAYRQGEHPFRSHLGASVLGADCGREIWYGWHWAARGQFSGQILRLFNRGHLEEARFIALLLSIGCQVYQQDEQGKQFRISHAHGHMGGSGDGVVLGLPDLAADQPALSEFKTHNQKSFDALAGANWRAYVAQLLDPAAPAAQFEGKGVRDAKFMHYVQMQTYMRKMGLAVGLYMAVNKNTDDIYAELVPLNTTVADQFLARGEQIVEMHAPPPRISNSPGFWKCRFCTFRAVCHLGAAPERNCRTCAFSTPLTDREGGVWYCRLHEKELSTDEQLAGCERYARRPEF